jgi:hypothetical protein
MVIGHMVNTQSAEELQSTLSFTKTQSIEDFGGVLTLTRHIKQTAYTLYKLDILNPAKVETTIQSLRKK